jgi:hypothetical protein
MKFPPIPDGIDPEWATNVPWRRPVFKVHTTRGLAHSAFSNAKSSGRGVQLCVRVDGRWRVFKTYDPDQPCKWCGKHAGNKIPYSWKGRVMDAPAICVDCRSKDYVQYSEAQQRARDEAELLRLQTKLR